MLTAVVEDQSGKEYHMDHYQVRFPTNVSDIGRVLVDLTRKSILALVADSRIEQTPPGDHALLFARPAHDQV